MIISICSEKGGVGKTTSAINIANGLVKLGKKVLVIDLDQQGNCSYSLGYSNDGKPTMAELIYNEVSGVHMINPIDAIRHNENGLDYIPSSPLLTNITSIISNDRDCNYVLKRCLSDEHFKQYDYILIDCRTLLDLLVANAMNTSKGIIIPVESGIYSYVGLEKMVDKVKSINKSTNPQLRILGILLNKLQRTIVGASISDTVKNDYSELTFNTTIPYCPAQVEKSVISQTSCVEDKNSSLGIAFMKLSKEIISKTSML
ncbi:MAG: ParA family protein [Oscillospiraceae bacterium]